MKRKIQNAISTLILIFTVAAAYSPALGETADSCFTTGKCEAQSGGKCEANSCCTNDSCCLNDTYGGMLLFSETKQLTSDLAQSGWGVLTPGDACIVYFEMNDDFRDTVVKRMDLKGRCNRQVSLVDRLQYIPFSVLTRPDWVAETGQFLSFAMASRMAPFSYFDTTYVTDSKPPIHKYMEPTVYFTSDDLTYEYYDPTIVVTDMCGRVDEYDHIGDMFAGEFTFMYGFRFSPDRTKIAFMLYKDYVPGKSGLWIVPADEFLNRKKIDPAKIIRFPICMKKNHVYEIESWSNDNEILINEYTTGSAYYNNKYLVEKLSEDSRLYKLDKNGAMICLAKHAAFGSFSPDSGKIVYVDTLDNEVWMMDKDGNQKTKMTYNGNKKFVPTFSNDGRSVLYTEYKKLKLDDSEVRRKGEYRFVINLATIGELTEKAER